MSDLNFTVEIPKPMVDAIGEAFGYSQAIASDTFSGTVDVFVAARLKDWIFECFLAHSLVEAEAQARADEIVASLVLKTDIVVFEGTP